MKNSSWLVLIFMGIGCQLEGAALAAAAAAVKKPAAVVGASAGGSAFSVAASNSSSSSLSSSSSSSSSQSSSSASGTAAQQKADKEGKQKADDELATFNAIHAIREVAATAAQEANKQGILKLELNITAWPEPNPHFSRTSRGLYLLRGFSHPIELHTPWGEWQLYSMFYNRGGNDAKAAVAKLFSTFNANMELAFVEDRVNEGTLYAVTAVAGKRLPAAQLYEGHYHGNRAEADRVHTSWQALMKLRDSKLK